MKWNEFQKIFLSEIVKFFEAHGPALYGESWKYSIFVENMEKHNRRPVILTRNFKTEDLDLSQLLYALEALSYDHRKQNFFPRAFIYLIKGLIEFRNKFSHMSCSTWGKDDVPLRILIESMEILQYINKDSPSLLELENHFLDCVTEEYQRKLVDKLTPLLDITQSYCSAEEWEEKIEKLKAFQLSELQKLQSTISILAEDKKNVENRNHFLTENNKFLEERLKITEGRLTTVTQKLQEFENAKPQKSYALEYFRLGLENKELKAKVEELENDAVKATDLQEENERLTDQIEELEEERVSLEKRMSKLVLDADHINAVHGGNQLETVSVSNKDTYQENEQNYESGSRELLEHLLTINNIRHEAENAVGNVWIYIPRGEFPEWRDYFSEYGFKLNQCRSNRGIGKPVHWFRFDL